MKRVLGTLLLLAMVVSVLAVVPFGASAQANEIQFRGFNSQKSDYAFWNASMVIVGKTTGTYNIPAEGTGYMGGTYNTTVNEMHHFIYAYNQNKEDAADGTNVDGCSKMLITDPTKMYISFDFYVSDASVVNNAAGDCNFGIDTLEFGTKEAWGSTFISKRSVIVQQLAACKDGWNHFLLPLSVKDAKYKTEMVDKTVTFCTMQFYICGINAPAGFVSCIDDVRIMNEEAAMSVYPERTLAKSVTDGIRAYPASATYNDFYKVYLAYSATKEEYKNLVIGWDTFATANASFKAQAEADVVADKAAAETVKTAIAALNKEITMEDHAAIKAARAAYDGLSDNQKSIVTNYSTLTKAETDITAAMNAYNQAEANRVREIIADLPTKGITKEHEAAIKAAREAYEALTDVQKNLVPNLATLEGAEKKLDEAYAGEVKLMLLELPETVTLADKSAIEAARAAYDALTDAQKALVPNYNMLTAAEEKLAALDVEPEKIPYGDVNGDEKIDAKDALMVLKASVGKIALTEEEALVAEVDGKEGINAGDALQILKYSVQKIDKFPIEK